MMPVSFRSVFTIPRRNSASQTSPMVGAAARAQSSRQSRHQSKLKIMCSKQRCSNSPTFKERLDTAYRQLENTGHSKLKFTNTSIQVREMFKQNTQLQERNGMCSYSSGTVYMELAFFREALSSKCSWTFNSH